MQGGTFPSKQRVPAPPPEWDQRLVSRPTRASLRVSRPGPRPLASAGSHRTAAAAASPPVFPASPGFLALHRRVCAQRALPLDVALSAAPRPGGATHTGQKPALAGRWTSGKAPHPSCPRGAASSPATPLPGPVRLGRGGGLLASKSADFSASACGPRRRCQPPTAPRGDLSRAPRPGRGRLMLGNTSLEVSLPPGRAAAGESCREARTDAVTSGPTGARGPVQGLLCRGTGCWGPRPWPVCGWPVVSPWLPGAPH